MDILMSLVMMGLGLLVALGILSGVIMLLAKPLAFCAQCMLELPLFIMLLIFIIFPPALVVFLIGLVILKYDY